MRDSEQVGSRGNLRLEIMVEGRNHSKAFALSIWNMHLYVIMSLHICLLDHNLYIIS